MNELRNGLDTLWDRIFAWLPQLVGALIILLIAYMLAQTLQRIARAGLHKFNLDDRLHTGRGGSAIQRLLPYPSRFLGTVVFWVVFVWGITVAVTTLGVPALNDMMSGVYDYLPNVLGAILIFIIAGTVVAAVDAFIVRLLGDTPTGKVAAAFAPVVIIGIATFMILEQLKIAPQIVTITYAGLIGSIFLGLALAFGLGGRDVAAQILQQAYDASRSKDNVIKRDLAVAHERAKQEGKRAKGQLKRAA